VAREASAAARAPETSTARLAKFFPEASPVRIPVRLTRVAEGNPLTESTVIEFGTPHEVLFASTLPLEFADMLRVQNSDGTLDAEASVVALHNTGGLWTPKHQWSRCITLADALPLPRALPAKLPTGS